VQILDTTSHAVTKTIAFAPPGVFKDKIMPVGIRFTPDRKQAVVALGRADTLAIVDVASATVTGYIPVGRRVWHSAIDAAGSRVFSANGLS
ncbi:hypothetical protein, partial [Enterococcus faecium]